MALRGLKMNALKENRFKHQNLYFRLSKKNKTSAIRNTICLQIFLLSFLFSGCATVVTSPEGTITSYVRDTEVQVYAPRSARAQKVMFDTADKQMIHEPDTPFRRFFNSHSSDFRSGKVDYAKTTILGDIIARLNNKEYIRATVHDVIERAKDCAIKPVPNNSDPKKKEKEKNLQNKHGKLLEDAIFKVLLDENYPNIRENRIRIILNSFFADIPNKDRTIGRKIWILATGDDSKSTNAFKLDLMQTLIEKQFFKNVIDDAVNKRLDLFKQAGSPVAPMQKELGKIVSFIKTNIGDTHSEGFSNVSDSLWAIYIESKKDKFNNSVKPDNKTWAAFKDKLQREIVQSLEKESSLGKAIDKVLIENSDSIVAKATLGDPAKVQAEWKTGIEKDQKLKESFDELKSAVTAFKSKKEKRDQIKSSYQAKLDAAVTEAKTVSAQMEKIPEALTKLADIKKHVKDTSPSATGNVSAMIKELDKEAKAVLNLTSAHPATINTNERSLFTELASLDKDQNNYPGFKVAVKHFSDNSVEEHISKKIDPTDSARLLQSTHGSFNIKFDQVESKAETLVTSIETFLVEVKAKLRATTGLTAIQSKKIEDLITNIFKITQTEILPKSITAKNSATGIYASIKNSATFGDKFRVLPEDYSLFKTAQIDFESAQEPLMRDPAKKNSPLDVFLDAVKTSTNTFHSSLSRDRQIDSAELAGIVSKIVSRIESELPPKKDITDLDKFTLGSILVKGLNTIDLKPDTTEARSDITSSFARVFKNHSNLVESGEPVLTAYLKSGTLDFPDPSNKAKAISNIPKVFKVEMAKEGADKKAQNVASAMKRTFEQLNIAFLFGVGSSNQSTITAFKEELYQNFRHRITETVKAERKANYDYWWLTFFPKAIPLGDNTLEGQSIIEVNFPQRVVPEEQYHRWLQDSPDSRNTSNPPLCSGECETHPKPADPNINKIQIATSVLNDFRSVLDSSDLTQKYDFIRDHLTEALVQFTSGSNNQTKYKNGLKFLFYKAVLAQNQKNQDFKKRLKKDKEIIDAAHTKLKSELVSSPGDAKILKKIEHLETLQSQNLTLLNENPSLEKLLHKDPELKKWFNKNPSLEELLKNDAMFQDLLTKDTELKNLLGNLSQNREELNNFYDKYPKLKDLIKKNKRLKKILGEFPKFKSLYDKYPQLKQLATYYSSLPDSYTTLTTFSTPLAVFFNELNNHIGEGKDYKFDKLLEDVDFYRNAFAWEDFDIRHVFFAALVASEKHIVLPQKVELFTNAYFNGIRRFAPDFSSNKEKALLENYIYKKILKETDTKRFVVPFKNPNDFSEISRYLLLKGIRLKDTSRLLTKYLSLTHQTDNMSFIGEIFTGLCTSDPKYSPVGGGGHCAEKVFENGQDLTTNIDCEKLLKPVKKGSETQNNSKITSLQALQCISKVHEKYLASYKLRESFGELANFPESINKHVKNFLFHGLKYNKGFQRNSYLTYPELWLLEKELDESREELRTLIVNKFHTNYPGVPDPDVIKKEYLSHPGRINSLIYIWLRDIWINRNSLGDLSVAMQSFLDKSPFLTKDAVNKIIKITSDDSKNINKWIDDIKNTQFLSDQIAQNLLDHVYSPFFNALDQLTKVERHSTPLDQVKKEKFKNFAHWGKPKIQKGIQVVDMLPASRDDLVSMSVNEGGAISNIAGKAEGAAAYDLNQLQMIMRNAELLRQALSQNTSSNTKGESEGIGTLAETLSQTLTNSRQQEFSDLSELNQGANLGAYSLGASAGGSLYSRARSAFAYSKRREYLDAAITAAGRGDHFAKWVVQKSDIRTPVLQQLGDRGDLLAARHNGYPNGDQPFHLLVKIPHKSVQKDWDGTPYILFNSAYVATKKTDWWDYIGNIGPLLKLPLWVINPTWWNKVEETVVGTTYPFKWDVKDEKKQKEMLRERNFLGGRIQLDDTDKIKYSEILGRIEAEKNFIKYTREAQSQDILRTMNELKQEEPGFRKTTNQTMQQQLNDMQKLQQNQRTNANIDSRQQGLETQIEQIRQILTPPPPADPAPAAPAADTTSSVAPAVSPPAVAMPQAETAVIVQTNR